MEILFRDFFKKIHKAIGACRRFYESTYIEILFTILLWEIFVKFSQNNCNQLFA